jgi:hypothetical protein
MLQVAGGATTWHARGPRGPDRIIPAGHSPAKSSWPAFDQVGVCTWIGSYPCNGPNCPIIATTHDPAVAPAIVRINRQRHPGELELYYDV